MEPYFEKLFDGIDRALVEEFLKIKKQHEENFNEYKDQFAEIFWNVYIEIAQKFEEKSPAEQKMFIRLGIADPRYISKEDFEKLREVFQNVPSDVFYYVDEWIIELKKGKIPQSTFEDVIQESGSSQKPLDTTWMEKEYERKVFERTIEEEKLRDLVKGVQGKGPYSKAVYTIFDEIIKSIGKLKKMDSDIKTLKETLDAAKERSLQVSQMTVKTGENKEIQFTEPLVIRQMVKKAIGKLGIQYPALASKFLPNVNTIFSKGYAEKLFNEFKLIDPKTLERNIRSTQIFMPPYVILVPGYGETGFCWEPIEGTNIYGRGRIVIPVLSRKGIEPFYQAFGEYRWKLEKELSFGRWMEEGLTGEYYKYLEENKLKGQPAEYFIKDYILWVTKEVQGIQKVDKEIREIFWRYIPFDDSIKEALSKKSYIYQQLWEKDLRRRQRENY
ncbi:hypothetical protein [Fervidobacterium gondwanense]|uniref:hypothetical protein n=1 Tax=Fervidobacterium gondwanense TaxID=44754 RepID=UPI003C72C339